MANARASNIIGTITIATIVLVETIFLSARSQITTGSVAIKGTNKNIAEKN